MSKSLQIALGGGLGAAVGFALTVLAAMSGLAYALARQQSVRIPAVIDVHFSASGFAASSGSAIVLPTLVLGAVGLLVGLALSARGARH